jgi:hypothetical protein
MELPKESLPQKNVFSQKYDEIRSFDGSSKRENTTNNLLRFACLFILFTWRLAETKRRQQN